MKLLTKKKQKEIIKLISEIGNILAVDDEVSVRTFSEIDKRNFDIVFEIGGFKGMDVYRDSIHNACENELAKIGGK